MRLSRANMPLASGYGAWCQALSGFHCKNLAPHFPPGFINLQYFCHSRWRNPVRLSESGLTSDALERLLTDAIRRRQAADALLAIAERVAAARIEPMSMEAIDREVKAVRAERRRRAGG